MHFVAALDDAPEMRGVLCLFEGVATGAADGYARVSGTPAATLLHLGPGLAQRLGEPPQRAPRARAGGEHRGRPRDLARDLRRAAPEQHRSHSPRPSRAGTGGPRRPNDVARDAADAIAASFGPPGLVATLVLPADVSWSEVATTPCRRGRARARDATALDETTSRLSVKVLSTRRARPRPRRLAHEGAPRARATNRGGHVVATPDRDVSRRSWTAVASVASPERLIYVREFAIDQLKDCRSAHTPRRARAGGLLRLPRARESPRARRREIIDLVAAGEDPHEALAALAEALDAPGPRSSAR